MSDTLRPPPWRHDSSLEMTAVMPRPPVSTVPGPTIEQLDDIERTRREMQTLVECEGPCKQCPCCHGDRMVTEEERAEWRRVHPQEAR